MGLSRVGLRKSPQQFSCGILDKSYVEVGPEEAPTETQGCFCCHRPYSSKPKIPYVRLERLKICAASSGEMPVFKLKPQKNDQDGSFLLIIECGTESSSMSIKVSLCFALSLNLGVSLFATARILALALS